MADFLFPEDELEHERKYQIALEKFFTLMREKEIAGSALLKVNQKSNEEKNG